MTGVPRWRSLLFVPAHSRKYVSSAHARGADGIILDLEDSVPHDMKPEARRQLSESVATVGSQRASVLVRVNRGLRDLATDLDAAIIRGVDALVLPKVESAEWVMEIADAVTELEQKRGIPHGKVRFLAQIESPRAMERLPDIASSHSRMAAMALGPEDFCTAVGGSPEFDLLLAPNLAVLFAARAAGLLPLGFVGSIGEFRDTQKLRQNAIHAHRLGFAGALAIHPAQVNIFNEAFSPGAEEIEWALNIAEAERVAAKNGLGAFVVDGKMVDPPVIRRAHQILALAGKIDHSEGQDLAPLQPAG
ncbi:CoA ester lyase [Microvirga sp. VF16]|uniref:HpcH/HpaI aldolase/citrate lyase family protein n=1 Tax=Microvirga sp. VF16 TaxID=2807101 RepID=UPI00193E1BA9|nr:CoA ester lyase [Microvirga sp. VF16]QRM32857.1 CoA ester lyase [Microvirga sp. VF16]